MVVEVGVGVGVSYVKWSVRYLPRMNLGLPTS
jgi:hypothetical protein